MKPNSGDDVVAAWKHIRQDPYARIKKGIGVCYHCGTACGQPSTCTARNKACFMCGKLGHYMRACNWRYETGGVPAHPVPLNPDTRMQICEELAEHVENFLEVMKDEQNTNNKPTRLLERDTSSKEAIVWLNKFKAYYKNKEKDLPNRGYQPCIQGRMVLNSYIDRHLEDKLDHDVSPGGGTEIIGE